MTLKARWSGVALWLAPLGAWPLGLGDIELRSALNQPLEADILLVSAAPDELEELRATLAAPETFERYGLDRPFFLAGFQFEVTRDNMGRDIIRVTSQDSITEPSVRMLVEATWSRGRLLRGYTLLLDSPGSLPTTQATPQPQTASRTVAAEDLGTYGPVSRGETLWGITERFLHTTVTMNQMMVVMYEANPEAFNGNMNILLQGASVRIPDIAEVRQLSASEATQEAIRQTAEWEGAEVQQARLRLVPASDELSVGVAVTAAADLENENATLSSELEEARRLLELRNEQLQELQALLSVAEEAASEPVDDLESVSAPPPTVTNAVAPTAPQPSLISIIMDWVTNPLLLIGLGLLVLVGTAVRYLRDPQRAEGDVTGSWEAIDSQADEGEPTAGSTERMRAQIKPEDKNSFVVTQPTAPESAVATDETLSSQTGSLPDPQTVTEVGMKLDLARAYIDMGDSEGARSLLEEVVEEGDNNQQQEAKSLIGGL